MLMVAEMTGTLSLIVPAMVAVGLATLIVRRNDDTIYRSQLRSRADSPAHRILTGLPSARRCTGLRSDGGAALCRSKLGRRRHCTKPAGSKRSQGRAIR